MRIAAYCRVSTDREEQKDSLVHQKEFFLEYTKKNGYELFRLYADEGISGTSLKKRVEFQRLMQDAQMGLFEMVVVKDISRVARNTVDFLQSIRVLKSIGVNVIFLTANDQESDQLRGYEAGAVDYITKPFSIGALQRKIRAMFAMLEHHKPAKDLYDDGRLFLDFSEQAAALNGKPLTLSPMEYKMLYLFCKNPRQVLTRQKLLERLWDVDEKFVDEHTLTTSISRIRGKIEAEGDTYIKTIYGIGYQWTGGERK